MTSKVNRDIFFKLASDLPEERLQAAIALIKDLSNLSLPQANEEWSYVLGRLIKGLSSDRNSARLGFSLCLTEVVNLAITLDSDKVPECLQNIDMFLDLLSSTLSLDSNGNEKGKKRKGKEERGLLFGKLFGLQALLNDPLFSNIFFTNNKRSEIATFATTFVNELVDLASRKNWIREPCLYTLYQTIQKLLQNSSNNKKFIESILEILDANSLTLTNEGLAIYLLLRENNIPIASDLPLKNKTWKTNDPLAKGNLPLLSDVLRDVSSSSSNESEGQKGTNWAPRLHFVWDNLLSALFEEDARNTDEEPSLKKKKKNNGQHKNKDIKNTIIEFPEFWQSVVDESFFNEKASSERKYLGFLIFMKTLPLVPSKWVKCCFSQNLVRSLINQSIDTKRHLHKISQRALTSILKTCESNPSEKLIPCIETLLFGKDGSINFDKLTKSKTVSKLLAIKELDSMTLITLFSLFSSKLSIMESKNIHFNLDTLLHLVRNHKMDIKEDCKTVILKPLLEPLVKFAFFTRRDEKNESYIELGQERLYSILAEVSIVPTEDNHSWQYHTLKLLLALEKKNELSTPLDESLISVKDNAIVTLEEIAKKNKPGSSSSLHGFESLLSMCLLQLFNGDVDSISTIEELCTFYKERKDDSLVGVTEILLGLLAQRKAILTRTSMLVWEQFIAQVGREELTVVLDVLSARENKQGFAQLFEGADEYEAIEKENDDDDDDEKLDADESMKSDDESDSESDISDDEEDEDLDNDAVKTIDKEATSALAKALNLPENIVNENGEVNFNQLDDLSGDEDEDDDEEESMDDEKMMELDDQLSQIFKHRKEALSNVPTGHKRKLEVRDSRESVIIFKQRMIDLLTIYIKFVEKLDSSIEGNRERIENLIIFIEPMIKCMQETLDRPLCEKISKLMKSKLFKVKINPSSNNVDEIWALMDKIHNEYLLTKKPGQHQNTFYSLCSSTSLYLARILVDSTDKGSEQEILDKIIDIYGETTKQWISKGKFGSNILSDFVNWLSSRRQN